MLGTDFALRRASALEPVTKVDFPIALYLFDVTWNEDEEVEQDDSNVVRIRDAHIGEVFYLDGVGTRKGLLGKVAGGLFGAGGRRRIKEAEGHLTARRRAGDTQIDILGFSRGAALALHFANEVNEDHGGAPVRFLGLFDTVASFGKPGNELNVGWSLTLPPNVHRCFHAMALDERRENFPLTRVVAPGGGAVNRDRLEEVWFRGVHSDIGGGKNAGLSSIALYWMICRAQATGLQFNADKVAQHKARRDPNAKVSKNFDPKADPKRKLRADDAVHALVTRRGSANGCDHNDPVPDMRVVAD